MGTSYPNNQRQNYLDLLIRETEERMEDGTNYHDTFAKVAFDWLDYDEESNTSKIDGAKDRGIDLAYPVITHTHYM